MKFACFEIPSSVERGDSVGQTDAARLAPPALFPIPNSPISLFRRDIVTRGNRVSLVEQTLFPNRFRPAATRPSRFSQDRKFWQVVSTTEGSLCESS